MQPTRIVAGLLGVAALALPAAAVAKGKPEDAGKGKAKKVHTVQYVFKGTWTGTGLLVKSGNAHVKRAHLVGETITLDLTKAKFTVADTNADGKSDASDIAVGDRVLVQARLPKKDPDTTSVVARKVVDQTHPASDDTDTETPETPGS